MKKHFWAKLPWHIVALLPTVFSLFLFNQTFSQTDIPYSPSPDVEKLFETQTPLVTLRSGSSHAHRLILLVQGIDLGDGQQWEKPIASVMASGLPAYFLTLNKRDNLETIVSNLTRALDDLRSEYPSARIDLFAYSAGGAAALITWSRLPLLKRKNMVLTTIASPIGGYDLMLFAAPFVRWFVGDYVEQLARGFRRQLGSRVLSNCRQLINTDCSLDPHACTLGRPINPQLLSPMLCGPENVYTFRETHQGILAKTIPILLEDESAESLNENSTFQRESNSSSYFLDL